MRSFWKIPAAAAVAFVIMQCVRPSIPEHPATAEIQVPPHIRQILQKDCYSCHSDQRRLAWYDEVEPAYWLVRKDILTAREHLDFSTLGSKPAAVQKATLYEAVNMIQLGAMPLPRFTALHPEARVSAEELDTLKTYLAPWAPLQASAVASAPAQSPSGSPLSLQMVHPGWNGISLDPSFESWKPLSFTDRGDNNNFRFILGNDIAVKAAEAGQISPWPEGSRIAKVAWLQKPGSDGMIYPGDFWQVEFMIKDSKTYASTDGWGWGRWRGLGLKPYGTNAHFVNECTGCHLPVKGNDYVYTPPITNAHSTLQEAVNNHAASLPATLPYQPLRWLPITMFVDQKAHTMSVLYGNETATQAMHARSAAPSSPAYTPGTVLSLVTWVQREDPHWFGGRIPDNPSSVEFVTITAQNKSSYRRFDGANLTEAHPASTSSAQRISFLTGLKPASLP